MAINKVEYGGNTLIDITDTTATESDVLDGKTFYAANGTKQTGNVVVPTKTSDLINDSGFIDNTYHDSTKQDTLTFDTTPTNNSTNPVTSGGIYSDLYNNYIQYSSWTPADGVYSVVNKSSVANLLSLDSNGKARISNLPTANSISDDSTTIPKTSAVNSALSSKANVSDIPTNVSDLTNDAGYISSYTETDPIFSASAASGITSSDITSWNNKSTFSGDYDDLTNKPTIPTVNNGKLAFSKDGVKVTEFTANSSTDVNVDLTNEVKDVQINGTSILSNKEANIKTNGVYNSSSNKIATMTDVTPAPVVLYNNTSGTTASITTLSDDVSNYSYLEIIYGWDSGGFGIHSTKLDLSLGYKVNLSTMVTNNNYLYFAVSTWTASGTNLTLNAGEYWRIRVVAQNAATRTTTNDIAIFKVLGYK